jgi:hypothetical protein
MSDNCTVHVSRSVIYSSRSINYKNIVIINDTSRVIRMTPQLGASLMIVILINLEVSFMIKIFL